MGGQDERYSMNYVKYTQEYDVTNNIWTLKQNLLEGRWKATGISLGDKIYCLGGSPPGNDTVSCEYYDSTSWKIFASIPTQGALDGLGYFDGAIGGTFGGKIYFVGGSFEDDSYPPNYTVWEITPP
jgi:hypothetical protein